MSVSVGVVGGLALTPIPVAAGYLLRRGKGGPVIVPRGLQVVVVATLMALAGAAVVSSTSGIGVVVSAAAALIAASAAAVDLTELRLPNVLTYALIISGIAAAIAGSVTGQVDHPWLALLAGGGYGVVMLLLALAVSHGGYGLGDVKLAAGLGIWVGLHHPTAVAGALLYGQILILLTLVIWYLISRQRRTGKAAPPGEAPLGPALMAGATLAVLFTG